MASDSAADWVKLPYYFLYVVGDALSQFTHFGVILKIKKQTFIFLEVSLILIRNAVHCFWYVVSLTI